MGKPRTITFDISDMFCNVLTQKVPMFLCVDIYYPNFFLSMGVNWGDGLIFRSDFLSLRKRKFCVQKVMQDSSRIAKKITIPDCQDFTMKDCLIRFLDAWWCIKHWKRSIFCSQMSHEHEHTGEITFAVLGPKDT